MAIDATDVLAAMDEEKRQIEESRPTGGTFKFIFLTLSVGPKKNGQPATVGQKTSFRPLYSLDQGLLMYTHTDYDLTTGKPTNAICAREIGKPCHFCNMAQELEATDKKRSYKLWAKRSLMLPVYMYGLKDQFETNGPWFALNSKGEDGMEKPISGMRVLELQNIGAIEPVYTAIRKAHSGDPSEDVSPRDIRTLDFIVECRGVKLEKKLTPSEKPGAKPQMDAVAKSAIPTREALREMILDARPPRVAGEAVNAPAASASNAVSAVDNEF